jgi:hypothetical protein
MRRSSLRFCILRTPAHPAARLELQLQRYAGASETAHNRADWDPGHFGCFFVAEPIHGYEQQRRPLIRRQALDRSPDLIERQARFDPPYRLIRPQPSLSNVALLLTDVSRADLVDPNRLHDAEHPAVEASALLKLMLARESAFARRLNEVVGLDCRAGESASKPAQSGQDRNELVAKTETHRI